MMTLPLQMKQLRFRDATELAQCQSSSFVQVGFECRQLILEPVLFTGHSVNIISESMASSP